MLVRLPGPFLSVSFHRQSENSMAPFSASFDYRSQIIDNCEFFVAKYDIVTIITVRDPSGLFKAYAIRSNQDSRDVLLASEPSDVVLKAISSLHAKSCEAAHHYIATNGFSHPPDLKKTRFDEEDERDEDNDDNDDAASFVSGHSASSTAALSYWGSSDDEAATTPASSADPHTGDRRRGNGNEKGNNNNVNNTSRRRSSKPPASNKKQQQQARESTSSPRFPTEPYDTEEEEEHQIQPHQLPPPHHQQHLPPRVRLLSPVRSATSSAANTGSSYRPPPPPPGWTGPQHMPMPPPPPAARAIPIPTPQSSSHHQQQPGNLSHYYHPHHRPSPTGQPIPPPLPPSAGLVSIPTAQPKTGVTTGAEASPLNFVGPMRMAPTYKASMPNLSQHRNSTSSLATTTIPPYHQQQHSNPNPNTTTTTTPPSFAGGPPPPPPPQPQLQPQRLYDVRLTIRFGRGEQRILESCRASVRALQGAAVAYVRAHAASFGSSVMTGADLQASVRSAFFGPSEAYDMSTYRGDDLSRLFGALSAGGEIPRFEVEVEEVVD
ncbi:hypothetical protein F4821DRAFT_133738 [Hypoxylon rubiginosum]|uniref:Uncharacterized protein n=1 Tax=Hypoxylon rubiginosum TaxID=110542 RepID=A0ACC0DJ57_9PEZI|nr:hypothetical protein F4821DRAFT_133738 [Hypoxylon rubiginosum]